MQPNIRPIHGSAPVSATNPLPVTDAATVTQSLFSTAITTILGKLAALGTAIVDAINALNTRINTLALAVDSTGVVPTHADLLALDTATINPNDIYTVIADETQSNRLSYYEWNGTSWDYLGSIAPIPDATTATKGIALLGAAGGAATFESDAAKLATVATDTTLTGEGTTANPLSVVPQTPMSSLLTPPMTDYSQDGFVVSTSVPDRGPSESAWKAFDQSTGTNATFFNDFQPFDPSTPGWIQIQLDKSRTITAISILGRPTDGGNDQNPQAITLQASNDGVTFTDIASWSNIPNAGWYGTPLACNWFSPAIPCFNAQYVRFLVTENYGSTTVAFNEIKILGY